MSGRAGRIAWPMVAAVGAVGVVLGGLWVGYGPIGGDPDRLYRPIKMLLAESLRRGTLPFWSDRLGLGVPLVAESHVAAFYPPNWLAYRAFGVSFAYRLMMWLHHAALAGSTYLYARKLAISPPGAALAAISFTLCGFTAIHCSHEPFYQAIAYLPLALWIAEGYLADGRSRWVAGLAMVIGLQLVLGHFQVQFWTIGLVLLTGLWRTAFDRSPPLRLLVLLGAVGWGGAIAAVQLGLTWDFARFVGQTERSIPELSAYAFPPGHLVELVLPRFFRELRGGPEDLYWELQRTSGYEACFYVGTIPLVLAAVGLVAPGRRGVGPWLVLIPASLALATMPHWWPEGYAAVLRVPGLGYFRAPARYTLIAGLGLALLAGRGFDRGISRPRFRIGVGLAVGLALALAIPAVVRATGTEFRATIGDASLGLRVGLGLLSWAVGLAAIAVWQSGRVGWWLPFGVAAAELGLLFHAASPDWGWEFNLPKDSPVLSRLAATPGVRRVGGEVHDLPILAGLATAPAYLGFRLPPPNPMLKALQSRGVNSPPTAAALRWLRRFGVSHGVWYAPVATAEGERLATEADPALDVVAYIPRPHPPRMIWRIVTLAEPLPEARVATRVRVTRDDRELLEGKSRSADESEAWYVAGHEPPAPQSPAATTARVVSWDGRSGVVDHDGACDLILTRTYAPGWLVRLDGGPELPVRPVDGGLQSIRLDGSGTTRVSVRYAPTGLVPFAILSVVALVPAVAALLWPHRRALPLVKES